MEYADGVNFAETIQKRRLENNPFSQEEILRFFTQICLALEHCHDRNILYCNLKSENIYITSSGLLKISDFSVSKILDCREY